MTAFDGQERAADALLGMFRVYRRAYDTFRLPVISTGRSFEFYRRVFFDGQSEAEVLGGLAGKLVVDIGCGLTPFTSNSMFRACHDAGIEFYGVDPKMNGQLRLGHFDRLKIYFNNPRARLDRNAPGAERRVAAYAHQLPFDDASVDVILSSWLLFIWIEDEAALAEIFAEFHRVLKPGGVLRQYPMTKWRPERIADADWREVSSRFEIAQRYLRPGMHWWNVPPSFTGTF
ncbi:class I SAM-dependent methyltransferase, partial [bacterium]|nr:class I SAM-dependent methyltransferase [bacterium]